MNKWKMRRKVLDLCIIAVVTFGLTESALQCFYRISVGRWLMEWWAVPIYASDPLRVYRVKGNLNYEHITREYRVTYETNSQGRERRIQAQDSGATTQKAVEQALAAYEGTQQNVNYNQAQLDLAKRDLEKTELQAPFDGVVSARHVEPFEEVSRGKPVFDVFVEGAMHAARQKSLLEQSKCPPQSEEAHKC